MAKKINLDKENDSAEDINKEAIIDKKDIYTNTTRPDLKVIFRPSGSYIIRDGKLVPNLNDDAMLEREKELTKKNQPKIDNSENNLE